MRTKRQRPPLCRRWLLLLRGLLGLGAISTLYYAVQLLPLADVATITFLAPVLVAVAAPLALGERTGRGVAAALPLSVVGVILVAQPTFLFGAAAHAVSALGVAAALAQVRRASSVGGGGGCMRAGQRNLPCFHCPAGWPCQLLFCLKVCLALPAPVLHESSLPPSPFGLPLHHRRGSPPLPS